MPEYIHCRKCKHEWEVSVEDPDATLHDAFDHTGAQHPGPNHMALIAPGRP